MSHTEEELEEIRDETYTDLNCCMTCEHSAFVGSDADHTYLGCRLVDKDGSRRAVEEYGHCDCFEEQDYGNHL